MVALRQRQGVVRGLLDPPVSEPCIEVEEHGTLAALIDHELGDNVVFRVEAIDDVGDGRLSAAARGEGALGCGHDRVTLLNASSVVVAHHDEVALVGAIIEARGLEGVDAEVEEDAIGVHADDVGMAVRILPNEVGSWGHSHNGDPQRFDDQDGELSPSCVAASSRVSRVKTASRLCEGSLGLRHLVCFYVTLRIRHPVCFRVALRFCHRLALSTRWGIIGD